MAHTILSPTANQAGAINAASSTCYVGGNVAETQPPERVVIEGENQAHVVNAPLGRSDAQTLLFITFSLVP
jgi:hypothetical protein